MKMPKPTYAFRRKGLNEFCTCSYERYAELSLRPTFFEVREFYDKQALIDLLEEAAQVCDRFQARNVGMQPAECAGAIRFMKETL